MPQNTPAEKTAYMREYYQRPGKLAKKNKLEREWYETVGKGKKRDTLLRRKYGIDLVEYTRLLESQGSVCAICHRPETRVINGQLMPLTVDHNHATKQVRGLLCSNCNVALGLLEESQDRMRQMAAYLGKWVN